MLIWECADEAGELVAASWPIVPADVGRGAAPANYRMGASIGMAGSTPYCYLYRNAPQNPGDGARWLTGLRIRTASAETLRIRGCSDVSRSSRHAGRDAVPRACSAHKRRNAAHQGMSPHNPLHHVGNRMRRRRTCALRAGARRAAGKGRINARHGTPPPEPSAPGKRCAARAHIHKSRRDKAKDLRYHLRSLSSGGGIRTYDTPGMNRML